jgi:hypothetical protein
MQRYAHAVQVNVVQRKLECRYGGKVCCLLSKAWMTRMEFRDEQCFGYASRTEWVDAAANHLEMLRLHNLHQPRSTAPLSSTNSIAVC